MVVLDIPAQVTVDALIEAVTQLPSEELEAFLARVNLIRRRQVTEADLLTAIQRSLPTEQQRRLDELRDKLEAETLSEAERAELLGLVECVEAADVERAEALLALAENRGVSVRRLMQDLGLEPRLA
jgi:hypothetical protein